MKEFSSAFGERISSFLDYRTARGFKRETYIGHFIRFDRWCMEKHPEHTMLSQELIHDWIDDDAASAYELAHRVAAYLFTDSELAALFEAIDILMPTKCVIWLTGRKFRLLYTTFYVVSYLWVSAYFLRLASGRFGNPGCT